MGRSNPLRLSVIAMEKAFRQYRASDFPDLPEMRWVVEDVFPEQGLLCVYGPSGVGKSFLCLDLAAAVAEGAVVEVDEDGEVIRWRLSKSKDGENGLSHGFKLKTVEFGVSSNGKPRKSCVVESVEGYISSKRESRPSGTNQQLVLDAAREFLIQHRVENFNFDFPDASFVGMPFNDLLNLLWERLINVPLSHRKDRARQALKRLCEMGFLSVDGEYITLPMPE